MILNSELNISFILNTDWKTQKSGAATFTRALLGGLDSAGIDYEVVRMRGEELLPEKEKSEIHLPSPRLQQAGETQKKKASSVRILLGYVLELLHDCVHLWKNRKLLRRRVIVVNEFGCETIPVAARIMFPFLRIIALAHTHPGKGEYAQHPVRRFIEKLCYRSVSDIVYNSESLKKEWADVGSRGRVIYYGIEEPDLSVPDDYPSGTENIDLLCASRFVKWKGHRLLIEAFVGAKNISPLQMRLILIGDGPELQRCMEYAVETNGRSSEYSNIIFMGARDDAARYFTGADIGIQLSIEPEAFGLVFLEAMSRGKPVIGTKIGGIPEVVGDCGLLVEPFDIKGAAEAIMKLVKDEGLRRGLGEKGIHRWKDKFALERMVDEYIACFAISKKKKSAHESHELNE